MLISMLHNGNFSFLLFFLILSKTKNWTKPIHMHSQHFIKFFTKENFTTEHANKRFQTSYSHILRYMSKCTYLLFNFYVILYFYYLRLQIKEGKDITKTRKRIHTSLPYFHSHHV